MVIVDRKLCKESCLLCRTVVLGIEFTIGKSGSREVCGERECKFVIEVGVNASITVVNVSLEGYGILCVVLEVFVYSTELNINVCGAYRSTVTVGFSDVVFGSGINDLARGILCDYYFNLLRTSEKTCPNES